MTVDLSESLAGALRRLAAAQGRDLDALVGDAVREYLETASITDVDTGDVAATQMNLMGESLYGLADWRRT